MTIEYRGFFNRKTMMKQWDSWRAYIADGGDGSWPRDAFEALLDYFEERLQRADSAEACTYPKNHIKADQTGTYERPQFNITLAFRRLNMTTICDLNTSILNLPTEEAFALIKRLRESRRIKKITKFTKHLAKARKPKTIKDPVKSLTKEQKQELLKMLSGG